MILLCVYVYVGGSSLCNQHPGKKMNGNHTAIIPTTASKNLQRHPTNNLLRNKMGTSIFTCFHWHLLLWFHCNFENRVHNFACCD